MASLRNVLNKKPADLLIWISIALVIATFVTFWPSVRCDYVTWDDPDFVTDNPHVHEGLTPAGIKTAFTGTVASNWHPITMLSHALSWQLWRFDPASDHLFNVALHALNVVILFLLLRKLTASIWRSAAVAVLFALHPLRVESVTWIAERKDLLCALFFFLSIWTYANWTRQRKSWRYVLLLFVFALGLMSKPMIVTLPFVLLLLDQWPLKRAQIPLRKRLIEKGPLFIMSAALCVVTFVVQKSEGSMAAIERWPFGFRFNNAVTSYWRYIAKLVWPVNLSPLYLPPPHLSLLLAIIASAGLIFVSAIIWIRAKKSYASAGWFWYLGMLVPVIGIVQVGSQSMADRYTYLPFIGLYIVLVWVVFEAVRTPLIRNVAIAICCVVFGLFAFQTYRQIGVWQNSETLFTRMLQTHPNNPVALNGLGAYYVNYGRNKEAIKLFEAALHAQPDMVDAHNNLGVELARLQKDDEAIAQFRAALQANPKSEMAESNLGKVYSKQGKFEESIAHYKRAMELKPDRAANVNELGVCYFKLGNFAEAIKMFIRAVELDPRNAVTHANLAKCYFAAGKLSEATTEYANAVALSPADPDAQFHYGLLLAIQNNPVEAERHLREALRLKPNFADAETALAKLRGH